MVDPHAQKVRDPRTPPNELRSAIGGDEAAFIEVGEFSDPIRTKCRRFADDSSAGGRYSLRRLLRAMLRNRKSPVGGEC